MQIWRREISRRIIERRRHGQKSFVRPFSDLSMPVTKGKGRAVNVVNGGDINPYIGTGGVAGIANKPAVVDGTGVLLDGKPGL